jgi:hypothetical protein
LPGQTPRNTDIAVVIDNVAENIPGDFHAWFPKEETLKPLIVCHNGL